MTKLVDRLHDTLLTEDEIKKAIRRNPRYRFLLGKERLWNDIQSSGAFQIWTKEFIESFAEYLSENITSPNSVILDAGAGNGLLTYWLRESGLNVVAVDDRTWPKWSDEWVVRFPDWVSPMDYKDALETFEPEIVISSWMPPYRDWTEDFRACPSAKEYILIGEAPKPPEFRPPNTYIHCDCGKWESWDEFSGWRKQELGNLTRLSISYFELLGEKETDHFYHNSRVVSFKRTR